MPIFQSLQTFYCNVNSFFVGSVRVVRLAFISTRIRDVRTVDNQLVVFYIKKKNYIIFSCILLYYHCAGVSNLKNATEEHVFVLLTGYFRPFIVSQYLFVFVPGHNWYRVTVRCTSDRQVRTDSKYIRGHRYIYLYGNCGGKTYI